MEAGRHYDRYYLNGQGEIANQEGKIMLFLVADISANGVQIITSMELGKNDLINISLHLEGFLFEKDLRVNGKVVHKKASKNGIFYGIEFVDMKKQDRIELDELFSQRAVARVKTLYSEEHNVISYV